MDTNARARTISSTQDHLEVNEILDDLIITKSGSVALVIQTSAINFDLLAEYEQDGKIYAFAGLLNSLSFHIQIMIRTRRIDISNYVDYLKQQENDSMSEGLKKQLQIYTEFIQNLIVQNDVLDKNFFIIIPFNPAGEIPMSNMLQAKKNREELEKQVQMKQDQLLEKAKIFLYPKRDHILKQLGRMGLFGHQLTTKELITELYTIYNPDEEIPKNENGQQ
ncbi:hypothetical protein A3K02_02165 [candidate division WS6 bacterium RIFOXYD1_FULL_33_8]|uniref:Uncharacterized protein n=2 Tax=Candidatus Dojkabacteria TaxID=74243 RepID=A0A0G0DII6_9BACT|nr:MAG: hypothetical protein UR32_C0005G0033 [candidate division WS6 bacterium GW2011_GWE2_33_157]KKP43669.1 MAG: hypothetical protein UR34_C0012G0021 [candidate division WS6 bacterium GW2011_GWC1_33_20]KKP45370.1 MAG: hypothetical protein UR36_C0008G0011 [candidate division WS6 bacterium GW2011_GWF1_33_233]KKP54702.1 MAG: hypothetical protein UR45_C0010G0021 [candidate division WS6 bacterium GW2011_WS6_33_547]KKP55172.1 MAG: hypothetical protein UR47_C0004G0021 [candidate division WS6 bacteriu